VNPNVSLTLFLTAQSQTLDRSSLSPQHDDVASIYSYSNLLAQDTAIFRHTNKAKLEIVSSPITENEFSYTSSGSAIANIFPYSGSNIAGTSTNPVTVSSVNQGAPIACFMINQPVQSVGQSFNVEIVQHVEYVGKSTASFHTPTDSDVVGADRISAAATQVDARRAANPSMSVWSAMLQETQKIYRESDLRVPLGNLLGAGMKMGAMYLNGRSSGNMIM